MPVPFSILFFSVLASLGYATAYTWNNTGDGNWTASANWTPSGFPDSFSDTALLGSSITSPSTVQITENISVEQLVFDNDTNGYTISSSDPSFSLSLGALGITVTGDHTISCPLTTQNTSTPLILNAGGSGGSLILTGSSSYSAMTTLNGGSLVADSNFTLSFSSAVQMNNSSILHVNYPNTIYSLSGTSGATVQLTTFGALALLHDSSFAGQIQGAGFLQITGGNTELSNTNTYTGGTGIASSTLTLTGDGSLSPVGNVDLFLGALDISNIGGDSASLGSISGIGTITLGDKNLTLLPDLSYTFNGDILGTGSVTLNGTGTEIFSGSNSYSGTTSILQGTLESASATGLASTSPFEISSAATLLLSNVSNTIGSLSGAGTITLAGSSILTITNGGSFTGNIGGSGGIAVTNGSLALNPSSANTYSGPTELNGTVILAPQADNALSPNSSLALAENSVLNLSTFSNAIGQLNGTSGTSVVGSFPCTLTINSGGAYSGSIGTDLNLELTGGNFTLSATAGQIVYTGTTQIGGSATLTAGATDALAPGSDYTVYGTLDIDSFSNSINNLQGTGTVSLGSAVLTVSNGGSFSGAINDGGSGGGLTISAEALTLNGTSSYSGATSIQLGATLQAGSTTAFAHHSPFLIDGTLNLASYSNQVGSIAGTGTMTLESATLTVANGSDGGAFSGGITGSGELTLSNGVLTLSNSTGANSYSGATSIVDATLQSGAPNSFSPNTPITLSNASILDLNGNSNAILSLASSSSMSQVTLGGGTLTINGGATEIFAGSITDAPCGGLTIAGGTTLTLTGSGNNYCGNTSVEEGALNINGTGALSPTTNVIVSPEGLLHIEGIDSVNTAVSIANSGTVAIDSTNLLTLTTLQQEAMNFSNTGSLSVNQSTLSGGTFTNANPGSSAAFAGTGANALIAIDGASVVNGTTAIADESTIGNISTAISFSSGSLRNNANIVAATYTQTGGTLNSIFSTSTPQFGTVATSGNLTQGGTFQVTRDTGSFDQPTQAAYVVLSTTQPGIIVGSFASETSLGFDPAPRFIQSLRTVTVAFGTCNGEWEALTSGNWADGSNWTCVPGTTGNVNDTASFANYGGTLGENITVLLSTGMDADQSVTLEQMIFGPTGNTSANYTILQNSSASTITFDSNATVGPQPNAVIQVSSGAPTINAPIILDGDTDLLLADGTMMTFGPDTTLSSSSGQVFTVANLNNAPLGTGTLFINTSLAPAEFLLDSATVQNSGAIQTQLFSVTSSQVGGVPLNSYFYNEDINTEVEVTGDGGIIILGGLGNTNVTNSGSNSSITAQGNSSGIVIGSSLTGSLRGATVVSNEGTGSVIALSGIDASFLISADGYTTVQNIGAGSFMGITGSSGLFVIEGDATRGIPEALRPCITACQEPSWERPGLAGGSISPGEPFTIS